MYFVPADVDLEFVPESEDINLGGVVGVEDEGEHQGQEEGRPASHQEVADGAEGNLSRDVHIGASHLQVAEGKPPHRLHAGLHLHHEPAQCGAGVELHHGVEGLW